MSRRESVQNLVGINDWPTQLAVLKVMFNTEDLSVKYLDDEEEEVKIDNQNDYEFANQIASSSTNNILRLIVRNSRDEIVGKVNLSVDLTTKSMSESLENSRITSSIDSMRSSIERIMPPPPSSNTSSTTSTLPPPPPPPTVIVASSNPPFTPAQIAWLDQHLGKFKSELMREIATNASGIQRVTLDDPNLISFIENETTASLENKVQRLFQLIIESRMLKRSLKVAYLEEELQSTGAFMAEFIKDQNMPDGSECEPGMRFDKTWLIRNIGKLEWTESKFPVRLVCIAGNIAAVDDVDCVNVPETCVGESASVSVTLIAPPSEGTYFSEWVLCCNGFKFGPRIWCTIQVTGDAENKEQLSLATSIYSEKANKAAAAAAAASQLAAQQAPSSMGGEDLDDEFVVIPDCFDLDKKWNKRQQQQQQQQNQQSKKDDSPVYSKPASINELGFHDDSDDDDFSPKSEPPPQSSVSVDLIMLDSDPVNKSLRPSDVSAINKSSLESSIERISTEPVESSTEIVVKQRPAAAPAADTTYLSRLVGERLTLLETQDPQIDFDDDLIETPRGGVGGGGSLNNNNNNQDDPRVTPERLPRQNESSLSPGNHHVNSNISQAIGLMKDALSNLGRPSYVGSIPMANETDDVEVVATTMSSVDENMKNLVMMGFANRQLNLKLLKKHNNDLNKVIQNLLEVNDNDWAQNR